LAVIPLLQTKGTFYVRCALLFISNFNMFRLPQQEISH